MKRWLCASLALLFYASLLPWNAGAVDYWKYNASDIDFENYGLMDNAYKSSPLNQTNQVHNGSFEWWSAFVTDNTVIQADGWRNGGNEIFTRDNTITYHGNYSLKMRNTPVTTVIGEIYQNIGLEAAGWIQGESWDPKYWSGKTVTFGCWIKATDADRAYTVLNDDVAAQSFSSRHTGDNTWQWLPVTKTLSAASTAFQVGVFIYQGSDITIYIDGCTLSESISSGNGWIGYSDKPLIAGDNKPNDPDRVSPISFHSLFQLKNPNVSHGMTDYADNNVYAKFFPVSTGTTPSTMGGGMRMYFFSDANDDVSPFQLYAFSGMASPASPIIALAGAKKSGTGAGQIAAGETLFTLSNWDQLLLTMLGDGRLGLKMVPQATLDVNGSGRFSGSVAPTTGAGLEFHYGGGIAQILGFNRTGGVYLPLAIDGLKLSLNGGSGGNVEIGGAAARDNVVGSKVLNIFNGTAPVGALANGVSIYSSAGELYTMDAAGNATLNSPHNKKGEWVFYSKNTVTGKVLKVDMERLMKAINDKFGWDFIEEYME